MGDSLEAMAALGQHRRAQRQRKRAANAPQVVGGSANLQLMVRGTSIDVIVTCGHDDALGGWKWHARGTFTNEEVEGSEQTWVEAINAATRAANGIAP